MTEDDIIEFASALPGTVAMTAGEEDGAPEVAWGDTFFFYDPHGLPADRRFPFATIVTKDYPGFDTASRLDRPGVFRVNLAVGRAGFERLIGYPPAAWPEHHAGVDYTVIDTVLPHPVYAAQAWVCILNPGDATGARVRSLLRDAHGRAADRHRPRRSVS